MKPRPLTKPFYNEEFDIKSKNKMLNALKEDNSIQLEKNKQLISNIKGYSRGENYQDKNRKKNRFVTTYQKIKHSKLSKQSLTNSDTKMNNTFSSKKDKSVINDSYNLGTYTNTFGNIPSNTYMDTFGSLNSRIMNTTTGTINRFTTCGDDLSFGKS